MGSSERVKQKKSGSGVLDAPKEEPFGCEEGSEIEGNGGVEPVEELSRIPEDHTEMASVNVEKRKGGKKKKGKDKIGLSSSLGNSQCVEQERKSHEEAGSDFNGGGRSGVISPSEGLLEVGRVKLKRRKKKEMIEVCSLPESKDVGQDLVEEDGVSSRGKLSDESIQATDIVSVAENNGTQACLKVYHRKSNKKKAKRKRGLAASKESKHSLDNMLEGNGGVSEAKSSSSTTQTTESVQEDKNDVLEGPLPELLEHKCVEMPSIVMEDEEDTCVKIYNRKSKKKKKRNAKGRIECCNSLTSKHVEQNLPEEHMDLILEKSSDECIHGNIIDQEDANALQEELLPELQVNGERNEGLSLSEVRDVADCSLSHSNQNKDSEGTTSNLCASIVQVPLINAGKKLLVLDLNGLLVDIVSFSPRGYQFDARIGNKELFKRAFCDDFLNFCFEKFNVGVWSSRYKKNVDKVVDYIMGDRRNKLLFCWDQSHCTDTGVTTIENSEKPLMLKELKKLWDKHDPSLPWELGEFNQSNTLLLDDSPYKALRNPPNTAVFPAPYCFLIQNDNSLGPKGNLRIFLEKLATADDVQEFVEQNPFGQRPITSRNPSWDFYLKIIQQEQLSCESTLLNN